LKTIGFNRQRINDWCKAINSEKYLCVKKTCLMQEHLTKANTYSSIQNWYKFSCASFVIDQHLHRGSWSQHLQHKMEKDSNCWPLFLKVLKTLLYIYSIICYIFWKYLFTCAIFVLAFLQKHCQSYSRWKRDTSFAILSI